MKDKYLESNIKIALYMGGTIIAEYKGETGGYFNSQILDFGGKNDDGEKNIFPNNGRYHSDICLEYHKNFNWLMPVFFKLLNEDYRNPKDWYPTRNENTLEFVLYPKDTIVDIYEFVIDKINYYNLLKNGKS